ncbi:MAG: phage tail tube protein, partial [Waterburya sp.]
NPTIAGIATLTIAVTGKTVTLTRGAGSWITDLIVPGQVVRITTGTGLVAANQNNNLGVVSMTATVLTCQQLSGTAFVAGAPTSVTVQAIGKSTFVPLTGHTFKSYSVEEFYSDINQSEVYSGLKVGTIAMSAPTEGMVTIDITMQGKDLAQKATTQYYTSPTAANLAGIAAGVSGAVIINGVAQTVVTSADFSINKTLENANVIGSNAIERVFDGRITANGSLSAYFPDAVLRDIFDTESRVGVMLFFTADSSPTAEVFSVFFPSVKFSGADKADAELGLIQTIPWEALLNPDTTGGKPATTVFITDSLA